MKEFPVRSKCVKSARLNDAESLRRGRCFYPCRAVVAIAALLAPTTLFAAPGEYGFSYTLSYWPSFLLFVFLLYVILRKPFPRFWNSRIDRIEAHAIAARERLGMARKRLEVAQLLYSTIDEKTAEIAEGIARDQEREAEALVAEARVQSGSIMERARESLELERRTLEVDAREKIAQLALQKAREKLKNRISADVDLSLRGRAFGNIKQIIGEGGR